MTDGPGKYDDLCTHAREAAEAQALILIVVNGNRGSGFSVQSERFLPPGMLAEMLDNIVADLRRSDNARPMSRYHQAAYALITIGKAAGVLSNDDVRQHVIDSMRRGELPPEYFTMLRDRLDEVLLQIGNHDADAIKDPLLVFAHEVAVGTYREDQLRAAALKAIARAKVLRA